MQPSLLSFSKIPKFPQVQRDLSLVMNKDVKYNDVISVIDLNKNKILKKVSLYDIYQGDSIGSNRIAYSMRFILQDESKTLGEKEINSTMDILIKVFEEELNAAFLPPSLIAFLLSKAISLLVFVDIIFK